MPYTIHKTAARRQMFWNISRPQEVVQADIPENWQGTPGQGLPVLQIPYFPFPTVVYFHPNRKTITLTYRNQNHEVVDSQEIATEHLTMVVGCEAHKDGGPKECPDCNKALDAALAEGWVKEPYLPEPPPKENADLYGPRSSKKGESK